MESSNSGDRQIVLKVIEAPPLSGLIRETRGFLELPRLLLRFRDLAQQPRGQGQPIMLLPGYGAGDGSTLILKSYLRLLGYHVHGWGLGRNSGDVANLFPRVLRRISSFAHRTRQQVRLIGWSLGGYFAREAARERPDLIQRVITLGTPVMGGPKYTVVARRFQRRGIDMAAIEAEIALRNQISLCTPVTAIYSRGDAVVAWEACIDQNGTTVEHVEVRTTHVGLGFSPEVYKIIAQRLADDDTQCCQLPLADPSITLDRS